VTYLLQRSETFGVPHRKKAQNQKSREAEQTPLHSKAKPATKTKG